MNKIDTVKNDNETAYVIPLIGKIIFAAIFLTLLYTYFDLGNKYYEGEELISKNLTVNEPPKYIQGGKGGINRYSFNSNEFPCRFWACQGALAMINSDEGLKSAIEKIPSGQAIKVELYKKDEASLDYADARIAVIGLSIDDKIIFSPEQVRIADKRSLNRNLTLGAIVLVILTVLLSWKSIKKIFGYTS